MGGFALAIPGERGPSEVRIGAEALEELGVRLAAGSAAWALLADEAVLARHGETVLAAIGRRAPAATIALPAGEASKRFAVLEQALEGLARAGLDRSSWVVGLGGGAATDLAGLAAALWMRGVRWAAIPTSLLAMVDASVGGKTAVNLSSGKNLAGAFHAPDLVAIDPGFLSTLPARELRSGLAEVVKAAVLAADESFHRLETLPGWEEWGVEDWVETLRRAVELKAWVVARDEREAGLRRALNLGHTLAHGLETALGNEALRHGEAVAIGLVAAADLAVARGLLAPADARRIAALLRRYGLPTSAPTGFDVARALAAIELDKKNRAGTLRYVLPCGLPAAEPAAVAIVEDVTPAELAAWLYSSKESESA